MAFLDGRGEEEGGGGGELLLLRTTERADGEAEGRRDGRFKQTDRPPVTIEEGSKEERGGGGGGWRGGGRHQTDVLFCMCRRHTPRSWL